MLENYNIIRSVSLAVQRLNLVMMVRLLCCDLEKWPQVLLMTTSSIAAYRFCTSVTVGLLTVVGA
jgi:hypothetical protein